MVLLRLLTPTGRSTSSTTVPSSGLRRWAERRQGFNAYWLSHESVAQTGGKQLLVGINVNSLVIKGSIFFSHLWVTFHTPKLLSIIFKLGKSLFSYQLALTLSILRKIVTCLSCQWKVFHQFSHYYFVWGCVLCGSVMSDSLRPHGLQPARLLCPWDFPGKDTTSGCHFLLQGISLTQRSNLSLLCLLHWRRILYCWAIRSGEKPLVWSYFYVQKLWFLSF